MNGFRSHSRDARVWLLLVPPSRNGLTPPLRVVAQPRKREKASFPVSGII